MASMPSRLIVSVLVGLAVAAGAVAAAGGTGTAGGAADGPAVTPADEVRLPALHAGDQGKYVTQGDELRFRFEQMDWVGPDGTVRPTLVLTQETNAAPRTRYWLEGTRVLAAQIHVGGGGSGSWTSLGNDTLEVMGMAFYNVQETRFGPDVLPPLCGLVVSLASGSLQAAGCGRFEQVDATLAFTQEDGDSLVLDEGLPVPAQLRIAGVTWDLAAFQRGRHPPAAGSGPSFPIVFSDGATPAEAGVEHEFHLGTALLFARDLPGTPLATFFAEHPEAYLASAAYRETVEPGRRALAWTLTASDGADQVAVEVVQRAAQAHDPPVTLAHGTGLVLPAAPVPTVSEVPAAARPYPRPGDWAPRFATLASLAERWEAAVPPGAILDGINAYGFDVLCAPADCAKGVTETWIGIDRIRSHQLQPELPACPTLACDYARWVWVVERMAVRDDGRTSSQLHSDWVLYDEASGPVGPLVVGEDREEEPPRAQPVMAAASLWAFPSSGAAAGAGIVGLASGLLCYLWPQLKAAAAGLWRRRDEPEHPTRDRLALLVASQPGIHFHELRRQSGLAAGTLRHHLMVMEERGTVTAHATIGYKVYFPPRGTARGMAAAAPALKAPAARRILQEVVTAGGLTMGEAAVVAGLTPSTATYHVRRLSEAGLVTRQRRGRTIALLPTALAGGALTGARAAAPA